MRTQPRTLHPELLELEDGDSSKVLVLLVVSILDLQPVEATMSIKSVSAMPNTMCDDCPSSMSTWCLQ